MRLPIAGGNWNNGATAGVFNLNLNNPRSNANWNIGFRAALIPICVRYNRLKGLLSVRRDLKDTVSTAQAEKAQVVTYCVVDMECRKVVKLTNAAMNRSYSVSIRNCYNNAMSFDGQMQALHDISMGRHFRTTELQFWNDQENYIHYLSDRCLRLDFPPDKYRTFYVYEPKLRKIVCCDFVTKILQRAIYNEISPKFSRSFITDTYACIMNKGTLNAALRLKDWMKYCEASGKKYYYLKLDIEKFFYRINHEKLMKIYQKKVSDDKLLCFLHHYICEASMPFGLPLGVKNPMTISVKDMLWDVGITIGGGLSHLNGNLYLDVIDQYVKRTLGIKYYVRLMDDMVILHEDKAFLHKVFKELNALVTEELGLRFNEKTCIRPISQGAEFVGYRIWPHRMTIRKQTSLRMKRHLKAVCDAYNRKELSMEKALQTRLSYKALTDKCDCRELDRKLTNMFVLTHSSKEEIDAERKSLGIIGNLRPDYRETELDYNRLIQYCEETGINY